jgi:hypothetical protein
VRSERARTTSGSDVSLSLSNGRFSLNGTNLGGKRQENDNGKCLEVTVQSVNNNNNNERMKKLLRIQTLSVVLQVE